MIVHAWPGAPGLKVDMEERDETPTGATVKALCVASNDRAAASKIHATTAHAGDYLIVPPKMESPCPVSGPPSKRPDLKRPRAC
jgi:hypothetical protein